MTISPTLFEAGGGGGAVKKCSTKRCKGRVTDAAHSDKCPKCRLAWYREAHPLAYAWGNLKRRAKQRGLSFSLSLEEYTRFAVATDYAAMKGKSSLSLSCDRIENGLGYHAWNIRAITMQENSRKQHVAYFNGGQLPAHHREEYLGLERAYRARMEVIAQNCGAAFGFGRKRFWSEFRRLKDELLGIKELVKGTEFANA